MRIMNSNFGLQNLMEKAPPLAATLHIPPAMCDGGHNKLKNRTIQTFLCIQSPDVFNETCYFLESVQSSYKEREKKTQLAKKTSKCHLHYRQKKDFTSVLVKGQMSANKISHHDLAESVGCAQQLLGWPSMHSFSPSSRRFHPPSCSVFTFIYCILLIFFQICCNRKFCLVNI